MTGRAGGDTSTVCIFEEGCSCYPEHRTTKQFRIVLLDAYLTLDARLSIYHFPRQRFFAVLLTAAHNSTVLYHESLMIRDYSLLMT